jgi:hypothetical protein
LIGYRIYTGTFECAPFFFKPTFAMQQKTSFQIFRVLLKKIRNSNGTGTGSMVIKIALKGTFYQTTIRN